MINLELVNTEIGGQMAQDLHEATEECIRKCQTGTHHLPFQSISSKDGIYLLL